MMSFLSKQPFQCFLTVLSPKGGENTYQLYLLKTSDTNQRKRSYQLLHNEPKFKLAPCRKAVPSLIQPLFGPLVHSSACYVVHLYKTTKESQTQEQPKSDCFLLQRKKLSRTSSAIGNLLETSKSATQPLHFWSIPQH